MEAEKVDRRLLCVKDLRTYFYTELGIVRAVDGISFSVGYGDTLGILGESGSGKSVTALSILRLIASPPGRIESGEIFFEGQNVMSLPIAQMKKIRGNRISMIFQEPIISLNPVLKTGEQVSEAIRLHQGLSRRRAWEASIEMLRMVGIPSPEKRVNDYPHQMSGGMCQRIMIAIAISCQPGLIIADEPTTALDVTIQAQILDLLQKLTRDTGTSILLISHNIGVLAEMVQEAIVMYCGKIMEYGTIEDILEHPCHPYTEDLLRSVPRLDQQLPRLNAIPGVVPSLLDLREGCRFSDRCKKSLEKCIREEPPLIELGSNHYTRCWLHE
jgi:peptide/nickel transport system ATP-binding protein/oligopeptide transport system ATP-binding protein